MTNGLLALFAILEGLHRTDNYPPNEAIHAYVDQCINKTAHGNPLIPNGLARRDSVSYHTRFSLLATCSRLPTPRQIHGRFMVKLDRGSHSTPMGTYSPTPIDKPSTLSPGRCLTP